MNKDEMIKDIPTNIIAYDGNPKGQYLYIEQRKEIAEALYNADYRKVGEDEIVVKKQAYEKFVEGFAKQEEIAHSYEQGYTELLETNHQLQDELEKTKKEKKEVLQVLKDNIVNRIGSKYAVIDLTDIAYRANEYGIELGGLI